MDCLISLIFLTIVGLSRGAVQEVDKGLWGLARISNPKEYYISDGPYRYYYDGDEETTPRRRVTAYIIDTGITPGHEDFGGRARVGANFVQGETACDQNGHGTHVAATIGGTKYGICKDCLLVGVKVLSGAGMGSNQGVVDGIRWATRDCEDPALCVINMSLGGGANDNTDQAVKEAFDKGIPVIVAAGNSNEDACNTSPARSPYAFTVSASNITDGFASFSNWGSCTNIIAPGVQVKSAWISRYGSFGAALQCTVGGSENNIRTIDGTSMASPHVAGVTAYLATLYKTNRQAQETYNLLSNYSQKNLIRPPTKGTPNRLVYNDYLESEDQ